MRERKLEKDLEKKEKKSAEERGEDLQDTVARCPGELPPPLRKPLEEKLIHHFLIWGDSRRLHLRLRGPKSSPLCPQSLSKCCLSLKKIKSFLNSGAFKTDCMHNMQSVLLGENPLRGVSPRLREKP